MYTIFLVDDEPSAYKYLTTIIEQFCENFSVCGTARDGLEALEKIALLHPNIVLSDIKMPIMDGLGLAQSLSQQPENIRPILILVSGYAEFSYAQQAIQFGVHDYLLKPVIPADLNQLLQKLASNLQKKEYQIRRELLRLLCNGKWTDFSQIKTAFPEESYYLALIRFGGLPLAYPNQPYIELYSDYDEDFSMYGRDENESFYLYPSSRFTCSRIRKLLAEQITGRSRKTYYTVVLKETPSLPKDFSTHIKAMYQKLSQNLVLGENQFLLFERQIPLIQNSKDEKESLNMFEQYCLQGNVSKVRSHLEQTMISWGKQKKPEAQMKRMLQQIFYLLQKYQFTSLARSQEDYLLTEAFFYADDMSQLIKYVDELLFPDTFSGIRDSKIDTKEYFEIVTRYIQEHFQEAITLQSACKDLGISQTYLSRIIRKYGNESFKSYLTKMRISHAKVLLQSMGATMKIGEIAEQCGFSDQLYFSKVFRSCIGISPSEYLNEIPHRK